MNFWFAGILSAHWEQIMDVGMSIASTLQEIYQQTPGSWNVGLV